MPHISLAAEKLVVAWGIPITNSLVTTWLVMAVLFGFAIFATRRMSILPGTVQSITEILVGGLYDFFRSVTGKHIKIFFPLLASFFIFIIVSNWIGLLPGVGTIGFFRKETKAVSAQQIQPEEKSITQDSNEGAKPAKKEEKFTPIFRGPTADLNTTLALALVSVFMIQYYGFRTVGFHYSSRFINLANPIMFFVGFLEIVSELSKVMSFAFRLFGNIFAGEVLLAVIAFLIPFIAPLPFLMMELFVGFIQALVFSMLTAVFLNVAISHGEEHREERR